MLNDKSILITGGTGSFGNRFAEYVLSLFSPGRVIIYSRDEFKQFHMKNRLQYHPNAKKLRFFIGDIRDESRLRRALNGVDYVVHAAAMKQVPICEYNPIEAIRTNIDGATNLINAALDRGVKKVVALSTDKAVNPINLYGGTKLVSDKLFISANAYAGKQEIRFSVVRYGNVAGSRGSVIPYFKSLIDSGKTELPITDYRMTRFWISLDEGVNLVLKALRDAQGGETFISKIPSFKITDLAEAMRPGGATVEVGIREGEKLHEIMITKEDAANTYEYDKHFIIYPNMEWWNESRLIGGGRRSEYGFSYSSDVNSQWLSAQDLRARLGEAVHE